MARPGWHSRTYLPHRDEDGLVQHVVFRLADSLPARVLQTIELLKREEQRALVESALDDSFGSALLRDPRLAQIIADALLHFANVRYLLHAWCIMPNHVHALVEPIGDFQLGNIIKSWKAFSAARINSVARRSGRLWAADYFDRFMRTDEQLSTTIAYIENNPVTAKLCSKPSEWRFSSAYMRA